MELRFEGRVAVVTGGAMRYQISTLASSAFAALPALVSATPL